MFKKLFFDTEGLHGSITQHGFSPSGNSILMVNLNFQSFGVFVTRVVFGSEVSELMKSLCIVQLHTEL